MVDVRKTVLVITIAVMGMIDPPGACADLSVSGSFDPNGSLGFANSNPNLAINYGGDGQGVVTQMDAFINVQGKSYGINGSTSADLDSPPPSGIRYFFSTSQPTADQLLLSYTFLNNTGGDLPGFQFLHYIDPDDGGPYDPASINEYATVKGVGSLGVGANPATYQVGDPSSSSIFTNLGNGTLNNVNDYPNPSQVGDVSFGLGFSYGTLAQGQSVTFDILLSDDGSTLGDVSITQHDATYPLDSLTVSGAVVVPEPTSLILLAIGSVLTIGHQIRRRTGPVRLP